MISIGIRKILILTILLFYKNCYKLDFENQIRPDEVIKSNSTPNLVVYDNALELD